MTGADFGLRLRRLREQHGLTQQELVDRLISLAWTETRQHVGLDRQMVSKWERGIKIPDKRYRNLLRTALGIADHDLGEGTSAGDSTAVEVAGDLFESPLDVMSRMQLLTSSNTNDETITQYSEAIDTIVELYEHEGPASLAAHVVRRRKNVQLLLEGSQPPHHREKLYLVAGKLSALLGYMAVNLGKFATATAYSREAFQLGAFAKSPDLQAWARGTQSFCAYYVGDFRTAADLARDGQRYARNGPQAVRLASNGEARALAKLGDVRGVNDAVERAYRIAEQYEPPPGVSSCISFGLYSNAHTASNAATAYVDLGLPARVQEFADQVMPVFEASESRWSQSLLRLDLAKAMVRADAPEPERAANLVIEALTLSAERPITSVLTRSREFLGTASRWRDLEPVRNATETLRAVERR
ncbi:multiprotein-bridging factor 1 family protein [Dactylosporangium sp. NPDC051541]|uniref:multiprotein-bridging factor 1 family protein n=1 Tax=Dactylosporangium sp. NPDC051541 TaxID=3363977 RepID=UPI0037B2F8BC